LHPRSPRAQLFPYTTLFRSSQNNSEKTEAATEHKVDNSKILSIIAYIGPLVIVSYLMSKESEFAKFHTKQGLILFAGEVALWVVDRKSTRLNSSHVKISYAV